MGIRPVTRYATLAVLMLAATAGVADTTLETTVAPALVGAAVELGNVEVVGLGTVTLSARRNGDRLIVLAINASGRVIGRGESPAGLRHTRLNVQALHGLERIVVAWPDS